jgi:hypothetical protein
MGFTLGSYELIITAVKKFMVKTSAARKLFFPSESGRKRRIAKEVNAIVSDYFSKL